MDTARIELKPGSLVRITHIGGDLRLTGVDSARLEAQAGRRGGLRVSSKAGGVELTCDGGCLVFLPGDSRVEIGRVVGDGRVTDLTGEVSLEAVDGDLHLRRLGRVSLGTVKGDLLAQRLRGELAARSIGGDARLEKAEGDVRIETVGGDLRITELEGGLQADVAGDARISFAPRAGSRSVVEVSGDLRVRVPPGTSLRADLEAAGDLRIGAAGAGSPDQRAVHLELGDGQAELRARAQGDLDFAEAPRADPSDLAGAITSQVEAALSEAESGLQVDLEDDPALASAVGDQVRRAVDRALRREREDAASPPDSIEAERQMILDMLASHRITADQAEVLFRALEPPD